MSSVIELLLRRFAGRSTGDREGALQDAVARATPAELHWVFDAGLGPMLCAAIGGDTERLATALRERMLASDLTAQVILAQRVNAALDAIDACLARGLPVTLLKGIALSHFHYDVPHFRPMTDVDVLVPLPALDALEQDLVRRGYWHAEPVMTPGAHHAEPLYHPHTRTRVELHSALFPVATPLGRAGAFAPESLEHASIASSFQGRSVYRLTPELQFVYLASAWNRDLAAQSLGPSFVFALFDAIALSRPPFDWDGVLRLADDPTVVASVDVLVTSLVSKGLVDVPGPVQREIRRRNRLLGAAEVGLLAGLTNGWLVRGRRFSPCNSWRIWSAMFETDDRPGLKTLKLPWYVIFPPHDPRRFDLAMQWQRLRRWSRERVRT